MVTCCPLQFSTFNTTWAFSSYLLHIFEEIQLKQGRIVYLLPPCSGQLKLTQALALGKVRECGISFVPQRSQKHPKPEMAIPIPIHVESAKDELFQSPHELPGLGRVWKKRRAALRFAVRAGAHQGEGEVVWHVGHVGHVVLTAVVISKPWQLGSSEEFAGSGLVCQLSRHNGRELLRWYSVSTTSHGFDLSGLSFWRCAVLECFGSCHIVFHFAQASAASCRWSQSTLRFRHRNYVRHWRICDMSLRICEIWIICIDSIDCIDVRNKKSGRSTEATPARKLPATGSKATGRTVQWYMYMATACCKEPQFGSSP